MKYQILHTISNTLYPTCEDPKNKIPYETESLTEVKEMIEHICATTAYTKYQFTIVEHPELTDTGYVIFNYAIKEYWPRFCVKKASEIPKIHFTTESRAHELITLAKLDPTDCKVKKITRQQLNDINEGKVITLIADTN